MFCYSNNGYSMRSVDSDYIAQQGEALFTDYATTEQLNTTFPLYNSGIPILSTDEKIILIEETYNTKFKALQDRLNAVLLSDGIDQEAKTIILKNEYKELSTQKDLEILEVLGDI